MKIEGSQIPVSGYADIFQFQCGSVLAGGNGAAPDEPARGGGRPALCLPFVGEFEMGGILPFVPEVGMTDPRSLAHGKRWAIDCIHNECGQENNKQSDRFLDYDIPSLTVVSFCGAATLRVLSAVRRHDNGA